MRNSTRRPKWSRFKASRLCLKPKVSKERCALRSVFDTTACPLFSSKSPQHGDDTRHDHGDRHPIKTENQQRIRNETAQNAPPPPLKSFPCGRTPREHSKSLYVMWLVYDRGFARPTPLSAQQNKGSACFSREGLRGFHRVAGNTRVCSATVRVDFSIVLRHSGVASFGFPQWLARIGQHALELAPENANTPPTLHLCPCQHPVCFKVRIFP